MTKLHAFALQSETDFFSRKEVMNSPKSVCNNSTETNSFRIQFVTEGYCTEMLQDRRIKFHEKCFFINCLIVFQLCSPKRELVDCLIFKRNFDILSRFTFSKG